MWWWCLCSGGGLIGSRHGLEHTFDQPRPDTGLAALVAELQELAAQDPDRLADGALAERVLVLRRLADRLEGHWLAELAAVDARGPPAPSRASRPAPPPPGCAAGCA